MEVRKTSVDRRVDLRDAATWLFYLNTKFDSETAGSHLSE